MTEPEFKPSIEDVKAIVNLYDDEEGNPRQCSDEQAQEVLDNWFFYLADGFYDFVKAEIMEGDILNEENE